MEIIIFIKSEERTKHESIAILDLNINSKEQKHRLWASYILQSSFPKMNNLLNLSKHAVSKKFSFSKCSYKIFNL